MLKTTIIACVFAVLCLCGAVLTFLHFSDKDELGLVGSSSESRPTVEPDNGNSVIAEGFVKVSGESKQRVRDSLAKFTEELYASQEENFEARAWLDVPNTNISYPVMLNVSHKGLNGELDLDYYLTRNLEGDYAGAYDTSAAIYADTRCDLSSLESLSRNTVIYGHNWTNVEHGTPLKVADPSDKQFSQLPSFADEKFAQKTTYFTLDLESEQVVCMIFAAMYVDTYNDNNRDGFYYIATDPSDEEFSSIVAEARARSEYLYKVPVGVNDKIVTLTTCTLKYGNNNNQRFVLMARILRPEEDISDFREPVKNLRPKRPDV